MDERITKNVDAASRTSAEGNFQATTESLSTTVVRAVADAADRDPAELGTSLYEQIDPDALDDLFSDKHNGLPRGSGHVVFSLLDYEVTVYSDGHVSVSE